MTTSHVEKNRAAWNARSATYQDAHGSQLSVHRPAWGVWSIPEDELRVLGDVEGLDVLELGCGGAQWSIALARRGARVTGMDLSAEQLAHARALVEREGVELTLVEADAEELPFSDASFDVVFCDHGAMSFADPRLVVPGVARVLRPGGLFAFSMVTPFLDVCWIEGEDVVGTELRIPYFEMLRFEDPDQVSFQLPYGEWIRLFRSHGFEVEDLVELRAPAEAATTYDLVSEGWARRWPAEHIWKVRLRT